MFTLIKGEKKITIPNNEVNSIQPTSDGLLLTTLDKTEIRMYFTVTPAITAILNMADNNLSKDLTIDLNAALRGDTSKIMSIGTKFEGAKPAQPAK